MDKSKASKKRRVSLALNQLVDKIMDSSDDEDLAAGSKRRLARTPSPRRAPTTPPSRRATYQPDPTTASTQPAVTMLPSCWASTQPAPLPERWATYQPDYTTPSTWPAALPPPSPVGSVGLSSSSWTPWSPTSYSPPRAGKGGKQRRKVHPQTANMGVPDRVVKGEAPDEAAEDKSATRRPSRKRFSVSHQKCIVL